MKKNKKVVKAFKNSLQQVKEKRDDLTNEEAVFYTASYPDTPSEVLEVLSNHPDLNVRSVVASHPNTDNATLEKLSNDEEVKVKNSIAKNPNVPTDILNKIIDSSDDSRTIYELASNPNLRVDSINSIFKKFPSDERILMALLSRPECPQEILLELFNRYFQTVENCILPTKDMEILNGVRILTGVAQCENVPQDILIKLSTSKMALIRAGAAKYIDRLPKDIAKMLTSDPISYVREKAIRMMQENKENMKKKKLSFTEKIVNILHKWLS